MRSYEIEYLKGDLGFTVSEAVEIGQQVPLVDGDIPVGVNLGDKDIKSSLTIVEPTLEVPESNVLNFYLQAPFRFFEVSESGERVFSQRTDSLTMRNPQTGIWHVSAETAEELNGTDIRLIGKGTEVYLGFIASAISKQRQ